MGLTTGEWLVKVGGAAGTIVEGVDIKSISWGYAFPRKCQLFFPGKHDVGLDLLTNNNEIWISRDNFATLVFRGALEVNTPRGVRTEGITYDALGLEAMADRHLIKWNSSIEHKYNIDNLPDYTSPSSLGALWTVGQIMVDILEHAIGIPAAGSAIPLHHPSSSSVQNPWMPVSVLKSYDAASLLGLSLQLSETRVVGQRFWTYMQNLVEQMGHHGIYIDPADPNNPTLVVHDFTASTAVNFYFGKPAEHITTTATASGQDALCTDSSMKLNISSAKTRIIVEGRGKIVELIPVSQGSLTPATMVPHWADGEGSPGMSWIVYDPQSYTPFWEGTLTNGLLGPILVVDGVPCHADFADWNLDTGVATTSQDLTGHVIEVWTLYLAPFQVIAGPGGTAYDNYQLIREEGVYDDKLIHSSHPISSTYNLISTYNYGGAYDCSVDPTYQENSGEEYSMPMPPRDDTGMMQAIANAMLARMGDERIEATISLDTIDLTTYSLLMMGNMANLNKWSAINCQLMQIEIFPNEDTMKCQLTNDIYRVASYAEFKRRYMLRHDQLVLSRVVDQLRHPPLVGGSSRFARR
jgi:hypothetical protein